MSEGNEITDSNESNESNEIEMKQRVALITGGTGRIGSAIARCLAERGIDVAIQYRRSEEAARRLVGEIREAGGSAESFSGELTQEDDVKALVRAVCERFGGLHILVNTVHGQFNPVPVAEMAWSDWDVHLDALKCHFLMCREVLAVMRAQHYGRIVYVSAGLSRRLFSGCSAYTTVKAGLNGFTKTLALEEGRNGITANIVAPGKVVPADGGPSTDDPDAFRDLNRVSISNAPLGRDANAPDIAAAVEYFVSEHAGGITGQTLFVAGGEIMP